MRTDSQSLHTELNLLAGRVCLIPLLHPQHYTHNPASDTSQPHRLLTPASVHLQHFKPQLQNCWAVSWLWTLADAWNSLLLTSPHSSAPLLPHLLSASSPSLLHRANAHVTSSHSHSSGGASGTPRATLAQATSHLFPKPVLSLPNHRSPASFGRLTVGSWGKILSALFTILSTVPNQDNLETFETLLKATKLVYRLSTPWSGFPCCAILRFPKIFVNCALRTFPWGNA